MHMSDTLQSLHVIRDVLDFMRRNDVQKKKTFSTMEIVLLVFLGGSLLLSYIQSLREGRDR
jgi:cell division protein FtsX